MQPLPTTNITFCLYHSLLNNYTWIFALLYFPLDKKKNNGNNGNGNNVNDDSIIEMNNSIIYNDEEKEKERRGGDDGENDKFIIKMKRDL